MISSAYNNNSSMGFSLEKTQRFSSPRKELPATIDDQATASEEAKKKASPPKEDGFFKTQVTTTASDADAEAAQKALAPLANLPTPVSHLMAGNNGTGMATTTAPQIYVINAGGTPPPPPTIDMEVDTNPNQPNGVGLLGLNPTTTLSLHEGAGGGGHHAEGHHGGGGYNWFNSVYPFALGGEGFAWGQQMLSGAAVGAVLAFMINGVGNLFEDDYLGPLNNCIDSVADGAKNIPFIGDVASAIIRLPNKIFTPKGIARLHFDKATDRRYKLILKPSDGSPAYVQASKNKGLLPKLGINGGYQEFAKVYKEETANNWFGAKWRQLKHAGENLKLWGWNNAEGILSNEENMKAIKYTDLERFGQEALIQFIGDVQQPRKIQVFEKLNGQPATTKVYEFDVALQRYKLILAKTIDKKVNWVGADFVWDEASKAYSYTLKNSRQLTDLSEPKQEWLKELKNSSLKTLNEIAPMAHEMLGGLDIRKNANAFKNTWDDVVMKYIPLRGMALGALIGGVLAMRAGYYEAGHKHLNINEEEHERNWYDPRGWGKTARSFIPF
ncbi:MAG: hypothetical protein H2174_05925 [Vampirovibrio sp.]|nr:hypothetical protein [Vampirovibrio sp.]